MERTPKGTRKEQFTSRASSELSAAAMRALLAYEEKAGKFTEPALLPQAERVVKVLDSFAPDAMPKHARDVAALQVLGNAIQTPNRPVRFHAAGEGLLRYFMYPSDDRNQQTNGYVGTLFGDVPYVNEAANGFEERLNKAGREILEGQDVVPPVAWQDLRVGANVSDLERISKKTNLETQLFKAAFVNDLIATNDIDDDQELLKNIIRAESFYSPLLEIYGLHAFDMMVQSSANKKRAIKSGNEATLAYATDTLDRAKQISTDQVMRQVFGRHVSDYIFKSSEQPLYGESILFSSSSLEDLTDGAQSGVLNARFKTVGKYTQKLLRGEHYTLENGKHPVDVFGMLAVLPDEQQLGAFFASTLEDAVRNQALTFTKAPSKKRPIFVQGSPDFVANALRQLSDGVVEQYVQTKVITNTPPDRIYQVAKFTFNLSVDGQELPVEFQVQTERDRFNARHGALSHMNHNAGEGMASIVPGEPGALVDIHAARYAINPSGEHVLPATIPHGEEFKRHFQRSISQ